ncbi:hypothetical protein ANN_23050 [Periplaneta americana]|uniref:Uncharacterized protein n=1 Tax=Periplaneta americana TaxID=6978 RepID=A0ABQ8SK03_PERAM|nr:hypothetical protein ANN_23050 [Periplaneta americana]
MKTLIENDEEFIRFVLFSEEVIFHLSGCDVLMIVPLGVSDVLKIYLHELINCVYAVCSLKVQRSARIQQLLSNFGTYSSTELRHLSYCRVTREVQTTVTNWFRSRTADFYDTRLQKMILRCSGAHGYG